MDLNDKQVDALKEISNIGMGHAATALSRMIGETVMLQVPHLRVADIRQIPELLGGAESLVAGIAMQMQGDARGDMLLIFPWSSAAELLHRLLGRPGNLDGLGEMEASALMEVGNILASAFLSALSNLTGMRLVPSTPSLCCDMAGAVLDQVLIEIGAGGDNALVVETEFHGFSKAAEPLRGHFFLLPDAASLALILHVLGAGPEQT